MEERHSDWRLIIGVILACAVVLVVAAFLLWVVFYGELTAISQVPRATGAVPGRASPGVALVKTAARPAGYVAPSGAYVSLSPRLW